VRVLTTEQIAPLGRAALEDDFPAHAELSVHVLDREALVLGAFQRGATLAADVRPLVRRVSGGPVVAVGRGTLHVVLALATIDALEPCEPRQIVNRHVRPLLRALTACGATARFFGRDWIDVGHRPAGWIGFAHDSVTGRAVLEAFVAVSTPFAAHPRAAYLGKEPGTLDAIAGRSFDVARVGTAIAAAYRKAWGERLSVRDPDVVDSIARRVREGDAVADDPRADPAWAATAEEPIGIVAAGIDRHRRLRVGGDLLVSRDAIARIEERVASAAPDAIGAIVHEELDDPRVALDGVRGADAVRDVIARALLGTRS
jgi:hypothetical protein